MSNLPRTLEEQEAVAELPRRLDGETDSAYLRRASITLGHTKPMPDDLGYTPDTVRLARRVLAGTNTIARIDAIFRGELDHVKPGQREPGSEG